MASPREAFLQFDRWKDSRTGLNLTVVSDGDEDVLQSAIFFADEDEGMVGFVDDASRNSVALDLNGDLIFLVHTRSVKVQCESFGTVTFVEVLLV
jgi:hypothetical protein